ncbi:hypothetical protein DPMN_159671 [Dreissena polymorpha]|uniref:Uncharacterized protein n=1 Tax=Dreissena polymorpha TaxID=45954 RepID=A0A9D4EK48_DREPO|nr:hypothetical protein DPMN_159671 [Dreissena polymorpha]
MSAAVLVKRPLLKLDIDRIEVTSSDSTLILPVSEMVVIENVQSGFCVGLAGADNNVCISSNTSWSCEMASTMSAARRFCLGAGLFVYLFFSSPDCSGELL